MTATKTMWKTELDDALQRFPRRGLLSKMLREYRALPARIRNRAPSFEGYKPIHDTYGIFAFATPTHLFVAKKAPYGDIVSVNTAAWNRCKETDRMIVMYLESNSAFYLFDPKAIVDTRENMRGEVSMTNFSIRHGMNLVKMVDPLLAAERRKALKKQEKMHKDYVAGIELWNSLPGDQLEMPQPLSRPERFAPETP